MKRPIVIGVAILSAASALSLTLGSGTGSQGSNQSATSKKKADQLGKAGLIGQGQAAAIDKMVDESDAEAALSNKIAKADRGTDPFMPGATGQPVAPQLPGQGGQMPGMQPGQSGQAAPPPQPQKPAAPVETPMNWRLEGTIWGGKNAPVAVIDFGGGDQITVRPGKKIDPNSKVISVEGTTVKVLHDKKVLVLTPW